MRPYASLLAASGLAAILCAAPTDAGAAPPIDKSDSAPHPLGADADHPPAEPQDSPGVAAAGVDPENPSPPAAKPKGKRVAMIWVQPGHELLGIGQVITLPSDKAEDLRGAGRARYATPGEVKLAGDAVMDLDGV